MAPVVSRLFGPLPWRRPQDSDATVGRPKDTFPDTSTKAFGTANTSEDLLRVDTALSAFVIAIFTVHPGSHVLLARCHSRVRGKRVRA